MSDLESDLEQAIERSSKHIPTDILYTLVKLTLKHSWLDTSSEALGELWNLCVNDTERQLMEDLIARFTCLDTHHLEQLGQQTASHICSKWSLQDKDTLIVATSDGSDADGSQFFIQNIKDKFSSYGGWQESNFCNGIGSSIGKLKSVNNVVLIDDFIGTGNTIKRRVDWYIDKLSKARIEHDIKLYVVAIAGMEFSQTVLDTLPISYYCPIWLKKGISEYYDASDCSHYSDAMLSIESRLEPIVRKSSLPSFGYKKSEALFAIRSLNIPNNVFPVFWWPEQKPSTKRKTLFRRLV